MPTAMDRIQSRPWLAAAIGAILLWGAFPPLGLFWLAPLAMVPWLALVDREESLVRKDILQIWLVSCGLWLGLLQGIRLAYWPLYAGWFALSIYIAVYLPLFIGLARIAVHRYRVPLAIAAPVIWVGLELIRGYFVTGFSTCLLAHTQVRVPIVLQIASQLGSYGVSAWVMLFGCILYQIAQIIGKKPIREVSISLASCAVLVLASLGYGLFELTSSKGGSDSEPLLKIALIQENAPTRFEWNPERAQQSWEDYLQETERGVKRSGQVDMLVWPESVFNANHPWVENETPGMMPPDLEAAGCTLEYLQDCERFFRYKVQRVLAASKGDAFAPISSIKGQETPTYLFLGSDRLRVTKERAERYNSALWIDPDGILIDHYDKQHLVMFGEYFPGGDWFPILYRTFGMSPVYSGARCIPIECKGVVLAPSICFESTLPHLIRSQIREVESQKRYPDILLNITNDGWFRGSTILDHHLASSVLAAVENRRPMLIAANTGLSAWIDGNGRMVSVSKRLTADSIWAKPTRDTRSGLWQKIGDLPARACGLFCIAIAIAEVWARRRRAAK